MIEFLLNGQPVTDISKRLAYEDSFTDQITIRNNSGFLLKNLNVYSTKSIAKFENVPSTIPTGEERIMSISISGKEAWSKRQKDITIEWEYELEL